MQWKEGFGENGGRWLKNWLNDMENFPEDHTWYIPVHGTPPATPPEPQPEDPNSTDVPADVQEQKTPYAAVLVQVPYGLPESDVSAEGTCLCSLYVGMSMNTCLLYDTN